MTDTTKEFLICELPKVTNIPKSSLYKWRNSGLLQPTSIVGKRKRYNLGAVEIAKKKSLDMYYQGCKAPLDKSFYDKVFSK